MTGSGEHRLDLETADTIPSPPPEDPESRIPTWPRMQAVREPNLELTTDVLDVDDEGLF